MRTNRRYGTRNSQHRNWHSQRERFDLTYNTKPNILYIMTDLSGKYAVTAEPMEDNANIAAVVIKPADIKNKRQWVMVDGQSGAITFFNDLHNYVNIKIVEGQINVNRSDELLNGLFVFNSDKKVTMKQYPNRCLAFKIAGPGLGGGSSSGSASDTATGDASTTSTDTTNATTGDASATSTDTTNTATGDASATSTGAIESFFANMFGSIREHFDPVVDTPLEIISIKDCDPAVYSFEWDFKEVYSLRDLTDNEDTIAELTSANASGDAQIAALQELLKNKEQKYNTDVTYKDQQIARQADIINAYEDKWVVKTFIKKDVNPDPNTESFTMPLDNRRIYVPGMYENPEGFDMPLDHRRVYIPEGFTSKGIMRGGWREGFTIDDECGVMVPDPNSYDMLTKTRGMTQAMMPSTAKEIQSQSVLPTMNYHVQPLEDVDMYDEWYDDDTDDTDDDIEVDATVHRQYGNGCSVA